jgi:hypothetical protein
MPALFFGACHIRFFVYPKTIPYADPGHHLFYIPGKALFKS